MVPNCYSDGFPRHFATLRSRILKASQQPIRDLVKGRFSDVLCNDGELFAITPRAPLIRTPEDMLELPVDE